MKANFKAWRFLQLWRVYNLGIGVPTRARSQLHRRWRSTHLVLRYLLGLH